MLGRLDDKDALKQDYSTLLNYFSDPVSELSLTYRGEFIDRDSIFNIQRRAQRNCFEFNFNRRYEVQYKPYYTATWRWERKCSSTMCDFFKRFHDGLLHTLIGQCHTFLVLLGLRHKERV